MFLQNKYANWYHQIIDRSRNRILEGYVERHHIIPKSCGGSNKKSNIVKLTPREHFLVHWLLTKSMIDIHHTNKMKFALKRLMNAAKKVNKHTWCKWQYETARRHHSEVCKATMTGENNPMFGRNHSENAKTSISKANKGSKRTAETKFLMSSIHKGKVVSHDTRSQIRNAMLGKPKSEEHCKKLSLAQKNVSKLVCPHCGLLSTPGNAKRWHFDNCKLAS
jgi:hypothetical protein